MLSNQAIGYLIEVFGYHDVDEIDITTLRCIAENLQEARENPDLDYPLDREVWEAWKAWKATQKNNTIAVSIWMAAEGSF